MKNYKCEKDYMFRVRASNAYGISEPSMSATLFAKAGKAPDSMLLIISFPHSCLISITVDKIL